MEQQLLVTEQERYSYLEDKLFLEIGTNVKHRILDVEKVSNKLIEVIEENNLSPWIEIRPIYPDKNKERNYWMTYQKDHLTSIKIGLIIEAYPDGNPRWQKIILGDYLKLNLKNTDERKMWTVLRFYPEIKGSPFAKTSPYYHVYDPNVEAKNKMAEVLAMKEAFDNIEKIKNDSKALVSFARYMGEEIEEGINHDVLFSRLLEIARRNPNDLNVRFNSKRRSFAELFHSANALGIIENSVSGGFSYRSVQLGLNPTECIELLVKDTGLLTSINEEVKKKDKIVNSIQRSIKQPVEKTEEFDL